MGRIVKYKDMAKIQNLSGMQIYCGKFHTLEGTYFSVNRPLAEALLKIAQPARTMQLERCLRSLLQNIPQDCILEDIDVLFNPAYQVDVLTMLVFLWRQTPFRLMWPGRVENNTLIYSEEERPDYRTFCIDDYDILCVI